jgi:hypothetical protein
MAKYYLYTPEYVLAGEASSLEEIRGATGASLEKIRKNLDTRGILECGLRVKTSRIIMTPRNEDNVPTVGDSRKKPFSRREIAEYLQKETRHI